MSKTELKSRWTVPLINSKIVKRGKVHLTMEGKTGSIERQKLTGLRGWR
jgi:hypothetical protein